jgi:hypothetical protein
VPAHHPTIVFDIIFDDTARSLGVLELALLLQLLLQDLWLRLRRRPLLGVRTDSATRQSERTSREYQNALLHLKPPQRHTLKLRGCPMRPTAERRQAQ